MLSHLSLKVWLRPGALAGFKFMLIFALVFSVLSAQAQKDLPVAGNAATLIDLLKKDYNAIDLETRDEEIAKDRNLVIGTFKAYFTETQLSEFETNKFGKQTAALNKAVEAYNNEKKAAAALSGLTITNNTEESSTEIIDSSKARSESLNKKRTAYFTNKSNLDLAVLKKIDSVYRNDKKNKNMLLAGVSALLHTKYETLAKNGVDGSAVANYNASLQKALPFIGGDLGFSMLADGLSKFLAKRIKQELTTFAMERVKRWLDNPSENDPLAEFKVLLPMTSQYLRSFSADKITSFPNEIKQYIEADLDKVLANAANLRSTPRIARLISQKPELDFAFEALEIVPNLSKVKQPVDYFSMIGSSRNIKRWKSDNKNVVTFNLANAMSMSAMLAYSMSLVENGEMRFAGSNFWAGYASETNFYALYVGFLYQQNSRYYQIEFETQPGRTESITMETILGTFAKTDLKTVEQDKLFFEFMLTQLGKNGEQVYNSALEIRKANKTGIKVGADTIHTFIKSIIDLSKEIAFASDTLVSYYREKYSHPNGDKNKYQLRLIAQPYLSLAETANNVIYDIKKKKYATGIISILNVTAQLTSADRNSSIAVAINTINQIQENPELKNWTAITKLLMGAAGDINFNDSQLGQLKVLIRSLDAMQIFVLSNNLAVDKACMEGIKEIKALATDAFVTQKLAVSDRRLAAAVSLLKREDFAKLVLAHFSGYGVDALGKMIEDRINNIVVNNGSKDVKVFEPADAANFKKIFVEFALQKYFTRVYGTPQNGKSEVELYQLLLINIERYIRSVSVQTGADLNTRALNLIHFANDMALAKDADDVEKAIEAFALPAGSYAIKRTAYSNFAINSYPGLLGSYEVSRNGAATKRGWTIGFTAPVGLSYTWGSESGFSYGFFLPVIDVGAITRLRLGNNTTENADGTETKSKALPELKFENIFSPGLYFTLGIPRTPFSINIGAQYGPELKEITNEGTANEFSKYYESFRYGLGLVFDIPLLNLHTNPRIR